MQRVGDPSTDRETTEAASPVQPAARPRGGVARVAYEALRESEIPCEFTFASGEKLHLGPPGPPVFTIAFKSDRALARGLDEYAIARAYVDGDIEIEGDMLSFFEVRKYANGECSTLFMLKVWMGILLRNPIRLNRESIAQHYSFGDDFYLAFIDRKYHLYSHCLFRADDETLEAAAEHKFDTLTRALKLEPGMRLLDIGAGWGAVTRYAGPRGIKVTALTIAEDSRRLHEQIISTNNLDGCTIRLEDFLEHAPEEPYDAVVILGVIEHIPQYRQFVRKVWECLKPGSRIYLDASAVIEKYDCSDFIRRYIYPGPHSYLCLPDLLEEFLLHGFRVHEVVDETREYELTLYHWASRFEGNRKYIIKQWGEQVFRSFRLYLWGGSHAMRTRKLQAYHVVAERTTDSGIRPGLFKRLRYFIRSLT